MTSIENIRKIFKKTFLERKLTELQRKITLASEILIRSKELHQVLKTEYETLDRELFETSPGITILPEKKAPRERASGGTPNSSHKKPSYDPLDYEKMSTEERKRTLVRLLALKKTQDAEA